MPLEQGVQVFRSDRAYEFAADPEIACRRGGGVNDQGRELVAFLVAGTLQLNHQRCSGLDGTRHGQTDALQGQVQHPGALKFEVGSENDTAGSGRRALIANGRPLIGARGWTGFQGGMLKRHFSPRCSEAEQA
jgi:hypothetical protein